MLYEYQALNPKMISITEIEPEPFSEQEDLAEKDGVGKISLGNGQAGYMGIVFNTQTEIKTTIPILNPKEQNSVEYDLSKAISILSLGMFADLADCIADLKREFKFGSLSPSLAATVISLESLENIFDLVLSALSFFRAFCLVL